MKPVVFINNEFTSIESANVSVDDRGYTFGDGIYEVVCAYNKIPYGLDKHIDRFFKSAEKMLFNTCYNESQVKDIILEGLSRVEGDKQGVAIYFQMTRGTEPRSHKFSDDIQSNFFMSIRPRPDLSKYRNGICKIITDKDIRWLRCDIKSTNLIGNILGANKAKKEGACECIFVRDGYITEGTCSNTFYVKDNKIYTEPVSDLILNGIIRGDVFDIAKDNGIEIIEKKSTLEEFYNADEVFMTSTTKLVLGADYINNVKIGNGKNIITNFISNELCNRIGAYCQTDNKMML